jgi:non-ribosomal peptide synthetase component F
MCALPHSIKIDTHQIASKFDFSLNIHHDPIIGQLSCRIAASLDLFNAVTVSKIGQRFLLLLKQLFEFTSDRPIYELSLILPDEIRLLQSINNTGVSFPPLVCLHQEFSHRASEQPQKVAVELDEQSLTYSEIFFYARQLAQYLGERRGQIICQCVERSIEMIIGQMAIISTGAAYCALSPNNSPLRLVTLLKQTGAHLVLVHTPTRNKFSEELGERIIDLQREIPLLNVHHSPDRNYSILNDLECINSLDDLAW